MFDTMMIAKRIEQARIDQNMTQLQLADMLGVSYQAVSNWERGNSMPDISKLADLCNALDLTVNELLGMEEKTAAAVTKAMEQEELTVEELKEVAPMLPPEQMKEQVENKWSIQLPDLSFLSDIPDMVQGALSEENLTKMKASGNVHVVISEKQPSAKEKSNRAGKKGKKKVDLGALAELAPFLDEEYLNQLVQEADLSDLDDLDELAPFLSKETLRMIAQRTDACDLDELVDIVSFLDDDTIDLLIHRCMEEDEGDMIEEFAPFARQATLDGVVEKLMMEKADFEELDWDVSDLYPFLSKPMVLQLAKYLLENDQTDQLDDVKDFL